MNDILVKRNSCVGIYCIKNTINNLLYIGSSKNIKSRFYDHKSCLKANRHPNHYLQNSYNKYGKENFEFVILELVEDEKNLIQKEQYYINFYLSFDRKFGFNLTKDIIRRSCSEETRKKISLKNKGRKHTEEALFNLRKNISRGKNHYRYGIIPSKTERRNQSERMKGNKHPNFGRVFGLDTRKKQSLARKGVSHKPTCFKPIVQLSLDGKILQRFESITGASLLFGTRQTISLACKKELGQAYGYKWIYAYSNLK